MCQKNQLIVKFVLASNKLLYVKKATVLMYIFSTYERLRSVYKLVS